jgi:hypothetical protein
MTATLFGAKIAFSAERSSWTTSPAGSPIGVGTTVRAVAPRELAGVRRGREGRPLVTAQP